MLIKKASGEQEEFDIEKLRKSLQKVGADPYLVNSVIAKIEAKPVKSTYELHQQAIKEILPHSPAIAYKYNLKQAIMKLGPSGFPFERFVSEIFKKLGYSISVDKIAQGRCIKHEIDIIGNKESEQIFVECKFRNQPGATVDVKVPLYIHSRFEDIEFIWRKDHPNIKTVTCWIATNVKFSSDSIAYAKCENIKLLGWSYPYENNIQELADKYKLHPITAITKLTSSEMMKLLQKNIVLCVELYQKPELMRQVGISQRKVDDIVKDLQILCK